MIPALPPAFADALRRQPLRVPDAYNAAAFRDPGSITGAI